MSTTFSESLRKAVVASGVSRYELARRTGVSQASLSRFINNQAGLAMGAIDKLVQELGLQLKPRERRKEG